jgi:hypothetical protein
MTEQAQLKHGTWSADILIGLIVFFILWKIFSARAGRELYLRRIPGLNALDEAIGRATEMGRPILFSPGLDGLTIQSLQALAILRYIVTKSAAYRSRVIFAGCEPVVFTVAEEVIREAYDSVGMPELYSVEDVRFVSSDQFAYAAGVVGILYRERVSASFLFGGFYAESLLLAEAGHHVGAIQVAGTPSTTQIPFFLAACDYTIIGDEFYAASAYLSREPTLMGSLVGQDYSKLLISLVVVVGIGVVSAIDPASKLAGYAHEILNFVR